MRFLPTIFLQQVDRYVNQAGLHLFIASSWVLRGVPSAMYVGGSMKALIVIIVLNKIERECTS